MAEQNEMEVRQKEELQSGEGTREGRYFRPPVDIFETDDEITVMADMPGCNPDELDINLQDSRLTISAATEEFAEEERFEPVYGEYEEGNFLREFRLGKAIDQSNISAHFNNGVLEVRLPKTQQEQTRKIDVQVE